MYEKEAASALRWK